MWKAAVATHPQSWEKLMIDINKVDQDTFKHLIVIPPRYVITFYIYITLI